MRFSIFHASVASFAPAAGMQPSVEGTLQKLWAQKNRLMAA
jgi:hypothetical protein